jgi:ATP synthase protein I
LPSQSSPDGKTPDREDKGGEGWQRSLQEASPFIGIGATMAASLALGLLGGRWLDGKLGTWPLFFLVGAGVGMIASFYHLFKTVAGRKR